MAKTVRNIILAFILIVVVVVGVFAILLTGGCTRAFNFMGESNPFVHSQSATVNLLIDVTGLKGRIDSELRAHIGEISAETGIPLETLEPAVDALDIKDWKVIEKPANAQVTEVYSAEANGTPVNIISYEDPSLVTVEAYGIQATFEVPESARDFTWLVPYLHFAEYLTR